MWKLNNISIMDSMRKFSFIPFVLFTVMIAVIIAFSHRSTDDDIFLSYQPNIQQQELKLYWKDDKGNILKSLAQVKLFVGSKHKKLVFAMNAGMYKTDNSPLGLFIENGKTISPLNTRNATGNFYLKPNGVFYIDQQNKAHVCPTENFINNGQIKYATQSGPMLLTNGNIHPAFAAGSPNVNIRNGVGILGNGHPIFVMSKKEINFYDFASYFKKLGCRDALFLDGFVCRTYLPEKNWVQTDGNFGVMVGVTATK